MLPKSKWPLFFVFCPVFSEGIIKGPCCNTTIGSCIESWVEHNSCREVVFDEGLNLLWNFLGSAYT